MADARVAPVAARESICPASVILCIAQIRLIPVGWWSEPVSPVYARKGRSLPHGVVGHVRERAFAQVTALVRSWFCYGTKRCAMKKPPQEPSRRDVVILRWPSWREWMVLFAAVITGRMIGESVGGALPDWVERAITIVAPLVLYAVAVRCGVVLGRSRPRNEDRS